MENNQYNGPMGIFEDYDGHVSLPRLADASIDDLKTVGMYVEESKVVSLPMRKMKVTNRPWKVFYEGDFPEYEGIISKPIFLFDTNNKKLLYGHFHMNNHFYVITGHGTSCSYELCSGDFYWRYVDEELNSPIYIH